jgi:plastocyanin
VTDEPAPNRSKWPIIAVFVAVVVLIVTFITGVYFSSTTDSTGDDSQLVTIDAMEALIDIKDFAYHPANISVPRGALVTWANDDKVQHTATEKAHTEFDTQVIHEGESVAIKFTTPGVFQYFCTIHPYMTATITVR